MILAVAPEVVLYRPVTAVGWLGEELGTGFKEDRISIMITSFIMRNALQPSDVA